MNIWKKIDAGKIVLTEDQKILAKTYCRDCLESVWHITAEKKLRVYCQLMSSLIDEPIVDCDGMNLQVEGRRMTGELETMLLERLIAQSEQVEVLTQQVEGLDKSNRLFDATSERLDRSKNRLFAALGTASAGIGKASRSLAETANDSFHMIRKHIDEFTRRIEQI